jgi:hypothetical protein
MANFQKIQIRNIPSIIEGIETAYHVMDVETNNVLAVFDSLDTAIRFKQHLYNYDMDKFYLSDDLAEYRLETWLFLRSNALWHLENHPSLWKRYLFIEPNLTKN